MTSFVVMFLGGHLAQKAIQKVVRIIREFTSKGNMLRGWPSSCLNLDLNLYDLKLKLLFPGRLEGKNLKKIFCLFFLLKFTT